jgi:hypothetical protein
MVLLKHVTTFTMQLQLHVTAVLQIKYRAETNWPRTFSPEVMSFSLLFDKLSWTEVRTMMKR